MAVACGQECDGCGTVQGAVNLKRSEHVLVMSLAALSVNIS